MFSHTFKANALFKDGDYERALVAYRKIQEQYPDLKGLFSANMEICRKRIARTASKEDPYEPEISVTLTSISQRLDRLLPVLKSLHEQTLQPSKIYLHLSEDAHLLDHGIRRNDSRLANLADLPLVEIVWTKNIGPFRKIVPFMEKFFSETGTKEKLFITVDDDTVYPTFLVRTLYEKYLEHDSVIAFRGRYVTVNSSNINPYSKWKLGKAEASMNNLPTGKDGILYSTKYFTREFTDMLAAMELTPTADDLWIKWHCSLNGVKSVILNPEAATSDYKSFPVVDYSASYRDVSLFKVHNSSDSGNRNDTSIRKLERYFLDKYGYNLYMMCDKEGSLQ